MRQGAGGCRPRAWHGRTRPAPPQSLTTQPAAPYRIRLVRLATAITGTDSDGDVDRSERHRVEQEVL